MKHHPTSKSDARENDHGTEECSAQEYEIMKVCHRFCSIIILDIDIDVENLKSSRVSLDEKRWFYSWTILFTVFM